MLLSACAAGPAQVLSIDTLRAPSSERTFDGLDARARNAEAGGVREISVVFLHGIGWTQREASLANDFAKGVSTLYGASAPSPDLAAMCPSSENSTQTGGLRISLVRPQEFETDLDGETLQLTHVGCLDKQVIQTESVRYTIYRFFWDNYFWDGLQYPHVGYDDHIVDRDQSPSRQPAAELRQHWNENLKDNLVTYGLSDAAMYIGPAGDAIREGVRAAICAAIRDSAADNFTQLGHLESGLRVLSIADACEGAAGPSGAFAFVSESLGSRVIFDVLRDARAAPEGAALRQLIAQQPEVFMLANQIPLVGLGQLEPRGATQPQQLPVAGRLVAISEVNDLLTYELVPYVEQLWLRTGPVGAHTRAGLDDAQRQALIEDFGFDVVDVRVRFAGPFLGVVSSFADPNQAHLNHAEQPLLMRLMVCGPQPGSNIAGSPCN